MPVQLGIWLPINYSEDAARSVRDPSSPRLPPKLTFPPPVSSTLPFIPLQSSRHCVRKCC